MSVNRSETQCKRRDFKAGWVAASIAILTSIIAVISLREAVKFGRLVIPPTYDDVVYFLEAARWIADAPSRTLMASSAALFAQHAPYATASAILGFVLVPNEYIGPYAVNALVIAAFLGGIARMIWDLPTTHVVTCLIGVACLPVVSQTLAEARPDLPWGLALGLALGAIIRRPLIDRGRASVSTLGVLVGLAVLIKPTAFPASLACVLAAVSIALMRDSISHPALSLRLTLIGAMRTAFFFGVGLAAITTPYIAVQYEYLLSYIYEALVLNRDFWSFNGSFYEHVVFYSVGDGGNLALWVFFWVGLLLFIGRLTASRPSEADWRDTISLLAVVVVAYLVPTLTAVKTYFLGATFYGVFLVAMALNFAAIVRNLPIRRWNVPVLPMFLLRRKIGVEREIYQCISNRAKVVFSALPITCAALLFSAEAAFGPHIATRFDGSAIQDTRAAVKGVWAEVQRVHALRSALAGGPIRIAFSSPYPLAPEALVLQALSAGVRLEIDKVFLERTLQKTVERLANADLIVVTSSIPHNLPGLRMGDEIQQALEAHAGICAGKRHTLTNGREIRFYARRDGYCWNDVMKVEPDKGF